MRYGERKGLKLASVTLGFCELNHGSSLRLPAIASDVTGTYVPPCATSALLSLWFVGEATCSPDTVAFREYGAIRRLFPPDIGGQMTMPLA